MTARLPAYLNLLQQVLTKSFHEHIEERFNSKRPLKASLPGINTYFPDSANRSCNPAKLH
jgi:hypothetical protein